MVAVRIDSRLAPRLDPSDVVQEALIEAHRLLPEYLKNRPVAFYPWLKQIATNRLIDLHRRHVLAKQRSVRRESNSPKEIDPSTNQLVDQLFHSESGATRLIRDELRVRVQKAVAKLPDELRHVLILRFVERKSAAEIALLTNVAEGTIRSRQFRALAQLRKLLEEISGN
jgi:RNA polymerase sigma-70 factor (ECF subfamily)